MSAWWQKSGHSFGIGKSEYSMRSRDVLMCSERYADDIPLALPKAQLPPTSSETSKQSKGTPCSARTLARGDARGAGADDADGGKRAHKGDGGVTLAQRGTP